jgi:uncharacterized phiE125 gp8 family phage protein
MWLSTRDKGNTTGLSHTVNSVTAGDIVTTTEVKNWARISTSDDDALITILIAAMEEMAEKYTGLSFRTKDITIEYESFGNEVILPYGPHTSVDAVRTKYQGAETTLASGEYYVTGQDYKTLHLIESFTDQQLEVDLTVGYGAANVPDLIKLALLKAVLSNYEDRQDVVEGGGFVLPNESKKLLDHYRRRVF